MCVFLSHCPTRAGRCGRANKERWVPPDVSHISQNRAIAGVSRPPGPESFGRQNVPVCPGPGPGRSVPALGRCCQRNEVCLEAWIFCWSVLSLVCRRLVLRFAVHFSHLDRFVIAGFGQSLQSPRRLASSRLAWATRRCMSFRSDVWALFWSYCRRACFLASTSSEVGSGRGDACWALCVALRGVLFPACFALVGGLPPALLGFGKGRVNSKVRPIAHSCGQDEGSWWRGSRNCAPGRAVPQPR